MDRRHFFAWRGRCATSSSTVPASTWPNGVRRRPRDAGGDAALEIADTRQRGADPGERGAARAQATTRSRRAGGHALLRRLQRGGDRRQASTAPCGGADKARLSSRSATACCRRPRAEARSRPGLEGRSASFTGSPERSSQSSRTTPGLDRLVGASRSAAATAVRRGQSHGGSCGEGRHLPSGRAAPSRRRSLSSARKGAPFNGRASSPPARE